MKVQNVFSGKKLLFLAVFLFFSFYLVCFDNNKEEKKDMTWSSVSECTFVNELISVGFSGDEALQNIGSCKDKNCPYHHLQSNYNLACK